MAIQHVASKLSPQSPGVPRRARPNVSSIYSLIPSIILIIRSWHTGRQAGEQSPRQAGPPKHRCTQEAFQVQRCWPSGERGQLLNTQPEPWRTGSYRVLCIHDTAWLLPCRHHIRLERSNWCVYSPQQGHLPLQFKIMDVQPCRHATWNKQHQTSPLDRLWM